MNKTTILGLIGGTLTTVSFLPQVIKTWKTKSTHDVSLVMFLLLAIGIVVWVIYGYLIDSVPVIISNIVSFALVFIILVFKIKYR